MFEELCSMITFDFLTGVAIGVILFQSALIAPTVLKTLDAESTRIFLRSIWPKFFIVLILLGGPAAVLKTSPGRHLKGGTNHVRLFDHPASTGLCHYSGNQSRLIVKTTQDSEYCTV